MWRPTWKLWNALNKDMTPPNFSGEFCFEEGKENLTFRGKENIIRTYVIER